MRATPADFCRHVWRQRGGVEFECAKCTITDTAWKTRWRAYRRDLLSRGFVEVESRTTWKNKKTHEVVTFDMRSRRWSLHRQFTYPPQTRTKIQGPFYPFVERP